MKRKRKIQGPFVAVPLAILDAPAWRAMDFIARALWTELRRKLRNDGLNNGKIYLSCRKAAEAIGANKSTIARRFAEIEHYGFLRKTMGGFLGSDGRGIAAKYRFTDLALGTHPPTRDYEKWSGELFAYTPRQTGRKKQNPVPRRRTYGTPPARVPYVPRRRT
jgi:DNA-binding transcriptional MocR family regulator